MSDDLADEIEAINSIFPPPSPTAPPTLSPSSSSEYILTPPPPSDAHPPCASLRIRFPAEYPATAPPVVEGTHSAAGRKGDAVRHLELFKKAVGTVWRPGDVCLYDAIEELWRLLGEEEEEEEQEHVEREEEDNSNDNDHDDIKDDIDHGDAPPWSISGPIVELKSTFLARAAAVTSPAQAAAYVSHLTSTDKRVRQATHNMTAWRIRGASGTVFQDCDDDGETAAGARLLHLLQLMDVWDVVVVVSRWYGGHKLGPRRFALINSAARDAIVKGGFVEDKKRKK